jgi:DNA topoisomerase-2
MKNNKSNSEKKSLNSQGKHLNPFQHALKRPDAYIGSIKTTQELRYVFEDGVVFTRPVKYNRGLMNIIREMGSNTVDHKWRSLLGNFHMKGIKITWDGKTGTLTFWNDGAPIAVELTEYTFDDFRKNTTTTEIMYPAEFYFGEFLTGTNFDDDEERKTSGRNGMGSKISVTFSKSFIVEQSDSENEKKFYQEYSENGKKRTKPKITSYKAKTNYTQISFIPDFERFDYPVVKKKSSKSRAETTEEDLDDPDKPETSCEDNIDSSVDENSSSNDWENVEETSEKEFDGGWAAADADEKPKKNGFKFYSDLEKDFIGVLGIYVLEIAGVTALPVTFTVNGVTKKYQYKTFDKYVRMFFPNVQDHKLSSIKIHNEDECVIVESHTDPSEEIPETLDSSRHISFVNGINTRDGGVHVEAWRDAIFPPLVRTFNSKHTKGNALKTTAKDLYPYITLFIRTEADKPTFDHNTKDKLNGPEYNLVPPGTGKIAKQFKQEFKDEIENLMKKMMKWNFVKLLEEKLLSRTGKSKVTKGVKRVNGGDKTQEAGQAAKQPHLCTLYITEGLSAKAFVVRGISCLEDGQEFNGILAIKGKFLNIRTSNMKAILANKEIQLLCAMLNLKIGVKYDTDEKFNTLRYHYVRFATDMDDDGIHIRGLLINFFFTYWPELFERDIFSSLSTAVTKVRFGNKATPEKLFFSNPEFKLWFAINTIAIAKDGVKYLKGLSAINPDDAPDYFLILRTVKYFIEGDEKPYMSLGFDGDTDVRNQRKVWLVRDMVPRKKVKTYPKDVDLNCYLKETKEDLENESYNQESDEEGINSPEFVYDGDLSVSTFVDRQLVIYHRTALSRALPDDIDGFKEGQRKAIHGILSKKYKVTRDLESVMGAIKEITGYHHGAKSLNDTVVKMASKYPGSNNIALLVDDGEFGTRICGGEDHGAGRYIATKERKIAKFIFRDEDIPLLKKVKSDGKDAEYEFFVPVINLLLTNGCTGIASGFSTTVPAYNPIEILNYQRAWLKGTHGSLDQLLPWYRGFKGKISLIKKKDAKPHDRAIKWRCTGVLEECGPDCDVIFKYKKAGVKKFFEKKCPGKNGWWHITEAPIDVRTDNVKAYLSYLETGTSPEGKKWKKLPKKCISEFKEYNTANFVHFYIKPCKDWDPSIDKTLKILTKTYSLTNMVAVDANYYPTRYKSPEHILEEWCPVRLEFYRLRHEHIIKSLEHNKKLASNRYIFIKAIVDKELVIQNQEDDVVEQLLEDMGLDRMLTVFQKIDENKEDKSDEESEGDENVDEEKKKEKKPSYEYLLSMQMRSMTKRKLEQLKKEIDIAKTKIKEMKKTPFEQLWINDMDDLEKAWKEYLKETQLV